LEGALELERCRSRSSRAHPHASALSKSKEVRERGREERRCIDRRKEREGRVSWEGETLERGPLWLPGWGKKGVRVQSGNRNLAIYMSPRGGVLMGFG